MKQAKSNAATPIKIASSIALIQQNDSFFLVIIVGYLNYFMFCNKTYSVRIGTFYYM